MNGEVYWTPGKTLEQMEKETILRALRFYNNNKTHTASSLGISIRSLQMKLNEYENPQQENKDGKTT
jgi:transcriptional regulator with PAS, ATPase and Fis domain